jgi:hypothetical protein
VVAWPQIASSASISATPKLTVKLGESQDVRGAKMTEPRKINTALSRGDKEW